MAEQLTNNAKSTLASAMDDVQTTAQVVNAAVFPTMGTFRFIVDSEIMIVTSVAGSVFTVTRGAEGTTATAHLNGSACWLTLTAGSIAALVVPGFTDPMTSTGDMIYSSNNTPTPTRLAVIADEDILVVEGGIPSWQTPTEVTASLDVAVGDSGSGGTKGLVPAAPAGSASPMHWLDASMNYSVPSGGSVVGTGTPSEQLTMADGAPAPGTLGWQMPLAFKRVFQYIQARSNESTAFADTLGYSAGFTRPGSTSVVNDANGFWCTALSGGVIGNNAGWVSATFDMTEARWNPDITLVVKTDRTSIASCRIWAGLTSADLEAISANPTTQSVAAFRYDTVLDAAGHWSTVTCDGSGTAKVTTGVGPIATATAYVLRIVVGSAQVDFYINGTLVASHTTHLPSSTVGLGYEIEITTLAGAAREVAFNRVMLQHGNI